ncbi:ubiquinone biosynthesis monooxygenase COQ6, mitochondrial-like isoform X1 [Phoenix dactylifera]|uniref:Ubiquinone biosynthesis monooxygenase COQ6, mitochondrial n=1 Tax=Phoenix dactylifera TaxID=42345 RepID=A0A8B8ZWI7_PHODC|nr:ubiquinone biosynthesis monooxygenase COQ6, mitochondrial-like isoform X1 [Phoenix dactylifera]
MMAALSTLLVKRGIARKLVPIVYTLHVIPRRNFCNAVAGGGAHSNQRVEKPQDCEEKVEVTTKSGQHDIAIVGGGMVGLALACALSSIPLTKHLSVAIIDSNPALGLRTWLKKDDIPDSRVSTVTPATISFFEEIGAWEYVKQQRHAFFDQMQVWDYTGLGYTRYNARDVGKECLGCVVENKVLGNSLLLCLQEKDFEKTVYPARLTSMSFQSKYPSAGTATYQAGNKSTSSGTTLSDDTSEQIHHDHLVKLDLSNGKSLHAKLVVGADGAKSHVREIAGLKTTCWNYSQSAVICTVEHTVENHCAWQRFLPSGPIALLPIGDKFSNIVWTMGPEESLHHKSMSEDDFVKAVNHALHYGYGPYPQSSILDRYMERFSWVTGHGTPSTTEYFEVPPKVTNVVSERMAFPLSLMHAHDYASEQVVLIGDAAHTVHPLAGQGVNLGFGDASALAKVIAEGLKVGTDLGQLSLLKQYEKERKAANVTMMAILDGFQKAYSVDLGPINLLRAAAFHGAQYIGPLKKNIMSYAMGEQKWPLFS